MRLVAATNEDLPMLAEQEKFRADLLDRLAFDLVTLPPLRQPASQPASQRHINTRRVFRPKYGKTVRSRLFS